MLFVLVGILTAQPLALVPGCIDIYRRFNPLALAKAPIIDLAKTCVSNLQYARVATIQKDGGVVASYKGYKVFLANCTRFIDTMADQLIALFKQHLVPQRAIDAELARKLKEQWDREDQPAPAAWAGPGSGLPNPQERLDPMIARQRQEVHPKANEIAKRLQEQEDERIARELYKAYLEAEHIEQEREREQQPRANDLDRACHENFMQTQKEQARAKKLRNEDFKYIKERQKTPGDDVMDQDVDFGGRLLAEHPTEGFIAALTGERKKAVEVAEALLNKAFGFGRGKKILDRILGH